MTDNISYTHSSFPTLLPNTQAQLSFCFPDLKSCLPAHHRQSLLEGRQDRDDTDTFTYGTIPSLCFFLPLTSSTQVRFSAIQFEIRDLTGLDAAPVEWSEGCKNILNAAIQVSSA
jgi:hypothetical protein